MYRRSLVALFAVPLLAACAAPLCMAQAAPRLPGELAWTIGYDPKSFDPAKVDDQESELVRYLTAGVLLRFDRYTQQVEPQLAKSWSVSTDRRTITFVLRDGLQFSDGSKLTAKDAAWSIRRVLLPATAAPTAEEFLAPTEVTVATPDEHTVVVHLSKPVVGIGKVFDEIAIEPADRPSEGRVTAGPFVVADYRRSQYVRLRRNEHYQGREGDKHAVASGIRLDVLDNAEKEVRLFQRGEYDIINGIAPDYFGMLKQKSPMSVRDLGPSLNTEQLWFNQASSAPIAAWEKTWFQSQAFRVAVSQAINRADLSRVAYEGHATPAYNFISPANQNWYNRAIVAPHFDLAAAKAGLAHAGFRMNAGHLEDASGHAVAFSILTNAGNAARMKMATLIQQDLAALGMRVTVVALDFPALMERLMHKQDYEACLLGLEVDPDPSAMMNVWLSSSPNHQWNPAEKTPATPWEAEIDKAVQQQAIAPTDAGRKRAVDRMQQIIADQQPFIYLVYPNALYAVSTRLEGVKPTVMQPGVVWNVENLHLQAGR